MMLAAVLLSAGAFAQQSVITGTVKDTTNNQVLPGATVRLNGQITGTDEFGRFRFENLSPGQYVLTITFLGYKDKTETIATGPLTDFTVYLEESFQLTDEVVVYATRKRQNTDYVHECESASNSETEFRSGYDVHSQLDTILGYNFRWWGWNWLYGCSYSRKRCHAH